MAKNRELDAMLLESARCGNVEEIRKLLADGADVNVKDDEGMSALTKAVISCVDSACALLLSSGAKASPRDLGKRTPLHYAAHNGSMSIVELLVEAGANVNAKDMHGELPETAAEENGDPHTADYLRKIRLAKRYKRDVW